MRKQFSLFQSHLDLAHAYWKQLLGVNDIVVDATCGNGQDTLVLCRLASNGMTYGLDIQKRAIELTREYLAKHLTSGQLEHVSLHEGCHSSFPEAIQPETLTLITYNLGYLPGSDKTLTTKVFTTLESIKKAQGLLKPGGALSITCYPGHSEGALEQEAILEYVKGLNPQQWNVCFHQWLNRQKAPGLLLIQKATSAQIRRDSIL